MDVAHYREVDLRGLVAAASVAERFTKMAEAMDNIWDLDPAVVTAKAQ